MFLKILVQFITAIWGIVFVLLLPVGMLITAAEVKYLPTYIPVLWIITAIVGFVVPCFLMKFRLYITAAAISVAGAVGLIIVHIALPDNYVMFFYMPLFAETVALILLAIFANMGEIRRRRYQKKKLLDAPAPSILGEGSYQGIETTQKSVKHTKKKGRK
jgi:hypothetical protein